MLREFFMKQLVVGKQFNDRNLVMDGGLEIINENSPLTIKLQQVIRLYSSDFSRLQ